MNQSPLEITSWLTQWNAGDVAARDRIFVAMYSELKRIAHSAISYQKHGSLQATGLLHDALLKMFHAQGPKADDRTHFASIVARAMRQVLMDRARTRLAQKRGGDPVSVPIELAIEIAGDQPERLVELDILLEQLGKLDPRAAEVVELRIFAGLTINETAQALAIHPSAVNREWANACEWLREELA